MKMLFYVTTVLFWGCFVSIRLPVCHKFAILCRTGLLMFEKTIFFLVAKLN